MVIKDLLNVTEKEMAEKNKTFYNIWMEDKNYLVQDVAHAFGEAKSFEICIDELAQMNESVRPVYAILIELYFVMTTIKHSNWYLTNQVICP